MVKDKEDVMPFNNRKGDEFVQALQRFHAGLPAEQQGMLQRIISAATQDDNAGDASKWGRAEDAPSAEQDDTAGYGTRYGRTEDAPSMAGTDSNDRWAKLAEWLNQADDDTSGYRARINS